MFVVVTGSFVQTLGIKAGLNFSNMIWKEGYHAMYAQVDVKQKMKNGQIYHQCQNLVGNEERSDRYLSKGKGQR